VAGRPKRLVVCADGTWNIRDQVDKDSGKRRPTNVTKIARAVLPRAADGTDQMVIYLEGVGTHGGLDKFSGGAFGHGIEDNVRSLYRSIVYNYVPGDELFFFGFSRGAFTVRTLAGFMWHVGLLEKDDDYYLPEIYGLYEKGAWRDTEQWKQAFHNIEGTRPCPDIKFMGVFDTVGALGAPGFLGQLFNRKKYAYHDVSLRPAIKNAYHALAIDERRKPVSPSLWTRSAGWTGRMEQAWFAGVHCNVGGGETPDGLANEALHWIVEKAEANGLEFDHKFIGKYLPCFNSVRHESMTFAYKALGTFERPVCEGQDSNEFVHQSAVDRLKHKESAYAAANLQRCVSRAAPPVSYVNTSRIPRGTPCPPLPPRRG
jgi:uncharacterized protein (DUF2235 family)